MLVLTLLCREDVSVGVHYPPTEDLSYKINKRSYLLKRDKWIFQKASCPFPAPVARHHQPTVAHVRKF